MTSVRSLEDRPNLWGAMVLRRLDWTLLASLAFLSVISLLAISSAAVPLGSPGRYLAKQLLGLGVGAVGLGILTALNYQIFRAHPGVVYGLSLLLLGAVLVIGTRIHGSKSWLAFGSFFFQPVELAKLAFILFLGALLDRRQEEIEGLRFLFLGFLAAGAHLVLLLLQPDLSSSLVYIPVLLGMLYYGGVRPLYLMAILFFGLLAAGIPFLATYFTWHASLTEQHLFGKFLIAASHPGREMIEALVLTWGGIFAGWWLLRQLQLRPPIRYAVVLWFLVILGLLTAGGVQKALKDYQRKRLIVFLSPGVDPLGAGYNILQSEITVGSGRILGKGLFAGTQGRLGFLPAQHTDFVFSVVGEEMGFVGAFAVVLAFALITWRAFVIAGSSPDGFGSRVAVGIGIVLGAQALMNIGMVLGLLPVTGLPLPWVSYGGSQVVGAWCAAGLLQSIHFRRYIYG